MFLLSFALISLAMPSATVLIEDWYKNLVLIILILLTCYAN